MTQANDIDKTGNRTTGGLLAAALALSLLWCLPTGLHLFGDGAAAASDDRLALALLAFAAPPLLVWVALLLALCLMQMRANAAALSDIATHLARPGAEERRLREQLVRARQENAALGQNLRQEWRELRSLLERFHEQGRLLRENGEEMEAILRETAAALPPVMERNLAQLGCYLDDSREQIGMLIRARAEQEAALSRGLAGLFDARRQRREQQGDTPQRDDDA